MARIPEGYELLTPQNAIVGLEFITFTNTPYTISNIESNIISVTTGRANLRFDLTTPNKFIRIQAPMIDAARVILPTRLRREEYEIMLPSNPVLSTLTAQASIPTMSGDEVVTSTHTPIAEPVYRYRLNPRITSRPSNFNNKGLMDYMFESDWVHTTTEQLDLYRSNSIHDPISNRHWGLQIGQLVLITDENTPTEPVTTWSKTRILKVDFIKDYLIDQIRVRYAMMEIPRSASRNKVIDSYMPNLLIRNNLDTRYTHHSTKLNTTALAISPFYAAMMQIPSIPASELCRVLGYSTKALKTLIVAVKQKRITIGFIGYGGTNINTIYWLAEILKFTGMHHLFHNVVVYEREEIETSNLLRFPKNPALANIDSLPNKLGLLTDELRLLSKTRATLQHSYFEPRNDSVLLNADGVFRVPNTMLYGAPGINTRVELSKLGNFISATHGSTECSIHLNPAQDTQLQVESYGVIQLNSFFMNQIRMAIGLLEVLASSQDLAEQNKEIFTYSFDGISKLKTINTYDFGITSSNMLSA